MRDGRRRSTRQDSLLQYSSLESRQLLAGVSVESVNGLNTLLIDGTNGDDVAVVSVDESSPDTLTVEFNGETTSFESRDSIDRIRFLGRPGDDSFVNNTEIDATLYGHDGNDRLTGGNGHNRIQGGNGDDVIIGGDKNDLLRGKDGNDKIFAGKRHDRVFAGNGNDEVFGSAGRDRIVGGAGNDILNGGNGMDRIFGGAGNDKIDFGNDIFELAFFDDSYSEFQVGTSGDTLQLQSASDGTDEIAGATTIRFNDLDLAAENFFVDLGEAEAEALRLINDFRADNGLSALIPVVDLMTYTENWTNDVIVPLDSPSDPEVLLAHHSTILGGYEVLFTPGRTEYAENIGFYPDSTATATEAMDIIFNGVNNIPLSGFFLSPSHLANLNSPEAVEVGIGVVHNSAGWYITLGFTSY